MLTKKFAIEIPEGVLLSDVIDMSGDSFRQKLMRFIVDNAVEISEIHAEGEDHSAPDYSIDGKCVECICMDVYVPKSEIE